MPAKTLRNLVRAAIICLAVFALFGCSFILPVQGLSMARANPELAYCFWPWLLLFWVTCLPLFAVLVLAWLVADAIGQDQVFTHKIASLVKISSILLFGSVGIFFIGNLVFLILWMSHPAVMLVSLFVDVFGLSLAVGVAVLARYLHKAADLQDEADGTI